MQPYEEEEYYFRSAVRRALALGALLSFLQLPRRAWSDSPHVVALSLVDGKPNGPELTSLRRAYPGAASTPRRGRGATLVERPQHGPPSAWL